MPYYCDIYCIGLHVRIQRGEAGGPDPPPPEKLQTSRVTWQYWSGSPIKISKLPSQNSMLSRHWHASEKKTVKVGPPLTKVSGSAHGLLSP